MKNKDVKIKIYTMEKAFFNKLGIKGKAFIKIDYEVFKHHKNESDEIDILQEIQSALEAQGYQVELY